MIYYITPREDCSRNYDIIEYSDQTIPQALLVEAILRDDLWRPEKYSSGQITTIYVDRRRFGGLMRKRDWDGITLNSQRSLKYVKKYNADTHKNHPLYEEKAE